jgi:hypothetical protein
MYHDRVAKKSRDLSYVHCEKGTGSCSETAFSAAWSASVDRRRRHSRDSCVWCGLDLGPHMSLAIDLCQSRLHIARRIVVDHHGLYRLWVRHLYDASLLEVPDKVIEIGTWIDVIRWPVIEVIGVLERVVWYDGQCWCHYGNVAILPCLSLS